ncbi:ABC transporter substrate-binding protein [Chromatiales bacterium (ex Bugula neritina AB1)]|nr:ABC transporter substrate-binding protein [Chromatiales bacterium (ex Bugula neritina AB1)]
MAVYKRICKFLDWLYLASGVIAALFLVAILCLIVLQMVARWTGASGYMVSSAPNFAGYCMAAASFFAFAHTLNRAAHIRVSIVLNLMGRYRPWLEAWCLAIAGATVTYLAWFAIKATHWSHKFHDISQGQDAWPIWIPQMSMAIGSVLLAVCVWDNLVRLIVLKKHAIVAETLGQH